MKKAFLIIFFLLFQSAFAQDTISGNVRQDNILNKPSYLVDSITGKPIEGAKIYVPSYDFSTTTDKNGKFQLNLGVTEKAILQVEKDGYKPFSLTLDSYLSSKPLKVSIERLSGNEAFVDGGVFHLGDNIYSHNSANCKQFEAKNTGPFYSSLFNMRKPNSNERAVIVFGSVIGLDTKLARELGQNKIVTTFSSPTDVLFNGQKIGELNLNGDNQKIIIPKSLIKEKNEVTVKTGKNLFQYSYIDYDDMEFANLRIEYENY